MRGLLISWYLKFAEWFTGQGDGGPSLGSQHCQRTAFRAFASGYRSTSPPFWGRSTWRVCKELVSEVIRTKRWYWRSLWLPNHYLICIKFKIGSFKTWSPFLPLKKGFLCIILCIQISFTLTFNETANILELFLVAQETQDPCLVPEPGFFTTWLCRTPSLVSLELSGRAFKGSLKGPHGASTLSVVFYFFSSLKKRGGR